MKPYLQAELEYTLGNFDLALEINLNREIGVLFGPSGAGKSITLRLLAGFAEPDRGMIRLKDNLLYSSGERLSLPVRERNIGLVFQQLELFPHLTVRENIEYGVTGTRSERKEVSDTWVERVHLGGLEERFPGQISGGQRQRTALARALAPAPGLLLLDEPFSALDGPLRRSLRRELKRIHRESGIPILYVTHDFEDVCALADRAFIMKNGRITGDFKTDKLWSPEMQAGAWHSLGWGNLLRGHYESSREGDTFIWDLGTLAVKCCTSSHDSVMAFVLPQDIKLLYPDIPVDRDLRDNKMSGRIVEMYSMGMSIRLFIESNGFQWHAEYPVSAYYELELEEGSTVDFSFRPEAVHLMPLTENPSFPFISDPSL